MCYTTSMFEPDFIGVVGERLTREFTVKRIITCRSAYAPGGTKPLYVLEDQYGNPAKWFASTWATGLEVDQEYTISGTVKKHENHPRFGMFTLLTRCKV